MVRKKGTELSVFKGREAKLSCAIFQTLALKGPQTIYDAHKQIKTYRGLKRTYYGNVNKRVRALEQTGYVKAVSIQNTKAGFEAAVYELTARAYLALMLNSINIDDLLNRMNEDIASEILAALSELTC
jgi:hypothetical protein